MPRLLPLSLILRLSISATRTVQANEAEELAKIKLLAPAASSMKLADLDKVATATTAPKPGDIEAKTLTWMLLCASIANDDAEVLAEFGSIGDRPPKPSEMAKEMTRNVRGVGRFRFATGPVTMIHGDRITDIHGEVNGDTATGVIKYRVPNLYQGKVHFVARKHDGKWRIEEFKMPARKVHIVLSEQGMWEEK